MVTRIIIASCIFLSFIIVPMGTNALSLEDNAWALSRVIRIDKDIREDTENTLLNKKRRAALLIETSKNIGNLMNTWNLVPTRDKTLDYTLTLQKYKLSCEIAAMKAVFGALGYTRSEDEIINTLPHHNKPYDEATGTWGDPDKEFVGLYQGSQSQKTGYGIYEGAIAKYFHTQLDSREESLKTKAWNEDTRPDNLTNKTHLTYLLDSIDTGAHVILWGDWCTAPEYEDGILGRDKGILRKMFPIPGKNICSNYKGYRYYGWKTVEGKEVIALSGDHVFVLLGYIGTSENPSHIIVWDTDTGRHIYPTTEWMRKWGLMQHRSLIVSK